MPEAIVESVTDFVSYLDQLTTDYDNYKFIFRGQSDSDWGLVPAVQRQLQKEVEKISNDTDIDDESKKLRIEGERLNLRDKEILMLEAFKKEAIPFLGDFNRQCDDIEWLALAQHHYLPTRLLDWTYHAATALYFAVEGVIRSVGNEYININDSSKKCAVWIARYDENFSVDTVQDLNKSRRRDIKPKELPFNLDRGKKDGTVLFYDPPHITPRLAAQQGCFTIHSSRYQVNLVEWPTDFKPKKIEIPYSSVKTVKQTLRQFGNRGSSLFPGLDGIALDIVSEHDVEKRHTDYPL